MIKKHPNFLPISNCVSIRIGMIDSPIIPYSLYFPAEFAEPSKFRIDFSSSCILKLVNGTQTKIREDAKHCWMVNEITFHPDYTGYIVSDHQMPKFFVVNDFKKNKVTIDWYINVPKIMTDNQEFNLRMFNEIESCISLIREDYKWIR